jgi:hypothetical protein
MHHFLCPSIKTPKTTTILPLPNKKVRSIIPPFAGVTQHTMDVLRHVGEQAAILAMFPTLTNRNVVAGGFKLHGALPRVPPQPVAFDIVSGVDWALSALMAAMSA